MNKQGTEIAALGEFGLIDRLTARLKRRNASTLIAAGDDAAVIDLGEEVMLLTTDMMTEGIDFDLSYFPLQHLGYKAIVRGVNDILAMNGKPEQCIGFPTQRPQKQLLSRFDSHFFSPFRKKFNTALIIMINRNSTSAMENRASRYNPSA